MIRYGAQWSCLDHETPQLSPRRAVEVERIGNLVAGSTGDVSLEQGRDRGKETDEKEAR